MIAEPEKTKELKIGLKLWSTESLIIPDVVNSYRQELFDYIELYVVPETYNSEIDKWVDFPGNIIIHCPHVGNGFNLADLNLRGSNCRIFKEVVRFADTLKSDRIIVHPGNNGSLLESIFQIKGLNDSRIYVENKPIEGVSGEVCVGSTPEDINKILNETGIRSFVLDFGHAVYAANTLKANPYRLIEKFLSLKPGMFHLSDGSIDSTKDLHLNFGEGTFDLPKLISYIPQEALVTFETPHAFGMNFDCFKKDLQYLYQRLVNKFGIKDFYVRLATEEDSDDMWVWRNHERCRKFSFNSEYIDIKIHKNWFSKKIRDADVAIYILEDQDNNKIGQTRFEKINSSQAYVNIGLNPCFFGKALGSKLIKSGTTKFLLTHPRVIQILAEILSDNTASIKAFQESGYVFKKKIKKSGKTVDIFEFNKRPGNVS